MPAAMKLKLEMLSTGSSVNAPIKWTDSANIKSEVFWRREKGVILSKRVLFLKLIGLICVSPILTAGFPVCGDLLQVILG
jgi:hypothetical protein